MDRPVDFGPYRLVRALGRGGMAETFVADRRLPNGASLRVCVKRVLPGLLDDPELALAFESEARIAATLRHANVACLVDHGDVDGRRYLALEWVEGVDLRALLRRARRTGTALDPGIVAEIAFGVVHALDFAHALGRDGRVRGLVHRDLSPSNVLLGIRGETKLADFGIAKVVGASHHTKSGILKGKIPYLPPEYIGGGDYGPRGDLFALGVMLFECLTCERPFDGSNDAETLHRIVAGERRRIETYRTDLHPGFVRVVDRLLAIAPDERPRSAHEVLDDLAVVAPTASVRARLANLVSELASAHPTEASLPFESTVLATVKEPHAEPDAPRARPDAETRTRAPRDVESTR